MNRNDFGNDFNNTTLSNISTIIAGHCGGGHVNDMRHPYSTPSSPLSSTQMVNSSMDIRSQKANMKLPVGSLLGDESAEHDQSKVFGVGKRPHVTVRDRYNYNSTSSNTISLSPIIPASNVRSTVQLTEPRAFRKLYPEEASGGDKSDDGTSSSGVSSLNSRSMFPYPRATTFEGCDNDPGETLCDSLKILEAFRTLESETHRLYGTRKRKPDEIFTPYDFEPDTFLNVNSEAANHALHLIFSTMDEKEAEQRFRDCWPIYEKKLEGAFRRVALDWIKQLITEYPDFFIELRSEAVAGLLVNPGGDRFIFLMRQLCRLAMFTLANTQNGVIEQQVLLPPAPTSDPEVINRQLHVLEVRTQKNAELSINTYKRLLKNDIAFSRRLRQVDDATERLHHTNDMQWARLTSYINNYPDLFGNPSEEEIMERENYISNLMLRDILEDESYKDVLRDRLQDALKKRSEHTYTSVSLMQDVMEDYGNVWHILEMDKSSPAVLNCNKIIPHQLRNNSGVLSLNHFVNSLAIKVENLISNDFLNSETPSDLLQDFEAISRRFNFLEMMKDKVDKLAPTTPRIYGQKQIQRNKVRKLRMNNFNWSLLSKIQDSGMSHLLDITPFRMYDINRSSGRTPGINNFLDSSSSSSSGEHQISIARKRNAQLAKKGNVIRRTNLQRSISDQSSNLAKISPRDDTDTTDGKPQESRKNYASDNIDATPLSTQSQSVDASITSTSLLQDSSLATPASAVSSVSFRMKKSVSFGDTPTTSSFSSAITTRYRRSSRFSAVSAISGGTPMTPEYASLLESESPPGENGDTSRLSGANRSSTPLVLDSYTQERLNKLLESVASSNHIRRLSSLSPIACSEVDAETSDSTQVDISPISDCKKPDLDLSQHQELEDMMGDLSIIEELEGIKGIMETSYVELSRNSDSDDM